MSLEPPMMSTNTTADIINPSTSYGPAMRGERKFSSADDESSIPTTMRALYYSPVASLDNNTYPTTGSPRFREDSTAVNPRSDSLAFNPRANSLAFNPRADSLASLQDNNYNPNPGSVPETRAASTANTTDTLASASSHPRTKPGPAGSLIFDKSFPTPRPETHQYLLKVQTAAFCQDELRLAMTLNPPKTTPTIPLHSVCGTVVTTPPQDPDRPLGPRYRIGDVVWGVLSYARDGGAADYVIANEDELTLKPPNITSTQAAALALPALTAWQALFVVAGIDPDTPDDGTGQNASDTVNRTGSGVSSGKGAAGSGRAASSGRGSGQNLRDGNSGTSEQRDDMIPRLSIANKGAEGQKGHRFSLTNLTGASGSGESGRKFSLASLTGSGSSGSSRSGSTDEGGRKLSMASIGSMAAASGRKLSLINSAGSGSDTGYALRKKKPLRILVTNARDSEVGRIAVQLLRAEKLFPARVRPWICVTCTVAEQTAIRDDWMVDQTLVIPHLPTKEECDLGVMFRSRKWEPVDIVLDCTGGEVFCQAHSKDVVRDGGAVLTAVDPKPMKDASHEQEMLKQRKRGLKSRFVPVNPDGAALKRIAGLVEDRVLKGREEQLVDLSSAARLLEGKAAGAAGSRRGGMMVVRVNAVC
ncbi:hypothetical protein N7466_000216 [Penicillium verhagenii]|uniref:uncharacterized protein n=1 Tax=Penicillium verhagenii TaxID=1562060 RepID=UPI002545529D|nr:uncharacterized protein N7466_000216 [Penicillium verhagenii]KAJ5947201.1 hypothetical protein N7466_000216 [Penicillium verhagenii]